MTSNILSQLKAATLQDATLGMRWEEKSLVSTERTQSNGWLYDQDHELMYKLGKKTGKLVQLETTRPDRKIMPDHQVKAEHWHMGLYGPGGPCLPHFDAFHPKFLPSDVWGGD